MVIDMYMVVEARGVKLPLWGYQNLERGRP